MTEIATPVHGPKGATTLGEPQWISPPGVFHLENHQVHTWRALLPDFCDYLETFRSLLSPDELARAARFKFSADRDGFIIRHGILRSILARYLKIPPDEVHFRYRKFGKPELKSVGTGSLFFNASRSADIALFALSSAGDIGVDLECVRPVAQMEILASRFFSQRENATLGSLPGDSRLECFFSCWTRKEALLKATGEGIGKGLSEVEVMLGRDEDVMVLRAAEDSKVAAQWRLQSFSPAAGYRAALAFERQDAQISYWAVPPSLATLRV